MFSTNNLLGSTIRALRLLISDAVWAEVDPVLRDLKHAAGSPGPQRPDVHQSRP